jgi:hypothetical protein
MKTPTCSYFLCCLAAILIPLTQNAPAELLMWWNFDEDAGSDTVGDQAGNDNDGDLMNFDLSEDSDLVPDGGKFGGAVHFDGEDDYINTTSGFQPVGEAFTYAYFFKPDEDDYTDGHGRDDHIYCNARPHFSFSRDGGGDGLMGMYYNIGGDTQAKSTTSEWNNDTWYHVAWTYNGEDIIMYVDGVEESVEPGGGVHTVQGDGRFNLGSNAGGNAFDGFMDDLTVWDEALSSTDVLAMAQSGVAAFLDSRNVDSDGDEMPDLFEQQIIDADDADAINTVADVLPGDDFDADGSTNLSELNANTSPVNADTDGDGLKDGVENKTGTWVSVDSTGTDPRNSDSDEDTLLDGVENPDLPYDPANPSTQPGTNPNLADTDGDEFSDGSELSLGTDPTDKNSVPEVAQRILFLGAAADEPTAGADQEVMDFLIERYGEPNIDYMSSGDADTGDELAYGTLILSSTFGSGTARNKFQDSVVPILNWEEALARDAGGEFAMSSGRQKDTSEHFINIKEDHPITTGYDVGTTVQMTDGDAEFWWSTDNLAPGSLTLAADDDDEDNNFFLQIIEQGEELLNGDPAPGKRIMLGITDNTFGAFTDDAKTLFGQAVDWLLGIGDTTGPIFQITEINRGDTEVLLTFTSKANKTYTIRRSTDLQNWLELSDGIESGGELTEFGDEDLPEDKSTLYYQIVEEE